MLYRQIQPAYAADLELLFESGLHDKLVAQGLLINAEAVSKEFAIRPGAFAVLRPQRIPTISYPYEWSFSQLQDAARLTLRVMSLALDHGMVLKDASAYNVQFLTGKPILIDTLSFEKYVEGEPWIGYRQFCQHFLAPLALMAHVDVRLGTLLRSYIDGVPLDLASHILPGKTRFSPSLLAHIHLHGKAQSRPATEQKQQAKVSLTALRGLIDNLTGTVEGFRWSPGKTEWGDYYQETNYTPASMEAKRRLVAEMIEQADPFTCWDLGANTGEFSRLAAERDIETVAWDVDPLAVERAYLQVRERGETHLLPLLQDLTNPSPDLGWAGQERDSQSQRGPADLIMALALIHHLAIGNNVPLPSVAAYFARLGRWAIVEFVPKADSQVRRMLANREDVFADYDEAGFERAFAPHFETVRKQSIEGTERTLYLLRRSGT